MGSTHLRPIMVAALSTAAVLSVAPDASAFCEQWICEGVEVPGCLETAPTCPVPPVRVRWRHGHVPIRVSTDVPGGIGFDAFHSAVLSAAGAWMDASCEGGGHPDIRFEDLGASDCVAGAAESDCEAVDGVVTVAFRTKDWPHGSGCAATTVTYDAETGELADAYVELNAVDCAVSLEPGEGDQALEAVLVQELGYVFGLANPLPASAVDSAAICRLYPPEQSGEYGGEAGGCSVAPMRCGAVGSFVLVLVGLLAGGRRAFRRRASP